MTKAQIAVLRADMQEIMRINNVLREIVLEAREYVPPTLLTKINKNVRPDWNEGIAAPAPDRHEGLVKALGDDMGPLGGNEGDGNG